MENGNDTDSVQLSHIYLTVINAEAFL